MTLEIEIRGFCKNKNHVLGASSSCSGSVVEGMSLPSDVLDLGRGT